MKTKSNTMVLVVFLLGIFMGAIDNGIVSPAREIIQGTFGVSMNFGMWMITIYTLSYAVSMPIVSKMADLYGHKRVYTLGIAVFAIGSMLCGLGNLHGNFGIFLASRVLQAIGAGGIIPIANSVVGYSFPAEKRGMALGLVGAMYGVATIIGPTIGSAILGIAGNDHWGWLFFINIPISILIIALSGMIEDSNLRVKKSLDFAGVAVVAGVIASLMYGLTNLDFFNLWESLQSTKVYPFLLIFLALIPVLIMVEARAVEPILNLKYFKNRQMLVVFALAFIVGTGMMGMIFIPQFAENVLKLKAGSGGYLVTLLAVFSGIAAPISGKLLDKKGTRLVMSLGFSFVILGTLCLAYLATSQLTLWSVFLGLILMGFGVGFTMGAPLNYLVLQLVPETEGAVALATMSLVRSIGVTISPSIMIGFIANAGKSLPGKLMETVQQGFQKIMPPGMSMQGMMMSKGQDSGIFSSLQQSDVTTIVDNLKTVFAKLVPAPMAGMIAGKIEAMRQSIEQVFQATLNSGYQKMFTATAIIATVGLICTFLLQQNKTERTAGITDEAAS